ncbi:MAG TPA: TonB-dependent receptor [Myxococcota bacterium]|jgi:TonB family protein|nr:TonB-dependent receptor [Myxococcota bacterium]
MVVAPGLARAAAPPAAPATAAAAAADAPVPPRLRKATPAPYPAAAAAAGLGEATVMLEVSIDAAGRVDAASVHAPSAHPGYGFEEAARAAAETYEFEPATWHGKPIASRVLVPVRFPAPRAPPSSAPTSKPSETAPATAPPRPAAPTTAPAATPVTAPASALVPPAAAVTLAGRVLEKGGREPLAGAIVALPDLALETETDVSGRFAFRGVPPGDHAVHVVVADHEMLDTTVPVRPGERTDVTFHVRRVIASTWRTTVRSTRGTTEVSHHALDADELRTIPGAGGDALRALSALPGVSRAPFGAGLLVVRGSAPEDTRIYVMSHSIPLPFHFGGVASAFNPLLLERVDFYPGGFGPRYGGATGGVIDLVPRDAARTTYHGVADVDVFDAGALVEGPVPFTHGKLAFAAAFRRSYIDTLLPLVLPDSAALSFTAAPRYSDWQVMLDAEATPADRFKLLLFGSDEKLRLLLTSPDVPDVSVRGELAGHTNFERAVLRWRHRHKGGILMELSVSGGYALVDVSVGENVFLTIATRDAVLRYSVEVPMLPRLDVVVGADLGFQVLDIAVRAPLPPADGTIVAPLGGSLLFADAERRAGVDFALWTEARWRPVEGVQIVPGLRIDHFSLIDDATVDPRLLVRWQAARALVLKTAAGVYHEAPRPNDLSRAFGDPSLGAERAVHLVVGAEVLLPIGVAVDAQVYYKWLDRLVLRAPAGADLAAATGNDGTGQVVGAELMLKFRPTKWLMGWVSYSLSRSSRTVWAGGTLVVRPFQYDQTHVVSAIARAVLGHGWELGLRWRFSTGSPYTPARGGYFDNDGDVYGPLNGDPNSARIPPYHELDVRVDKTFVFDWFTLGVYLDVMNAYNRLNPEQPVYSFDFRARDYFRGLPIIPSLGVMGKF